jgi:hypothetical protein
MSDLRELAAAELDIVGGGTMQIFAREPRPTGTIKVVEEIIVDIVRLLEPKLLEPKAPVGKVTAGMGN